MNGGVLDLHPPQHHFHRHVRQRLVARLTGKNEIARFELLKLAQNCDRARGQRNAMLPTRLHPIGRHRPDFLVEVDFGPPHSQDFAGTCGGQNAKFQRQRGEWLPAAEARR